MTHPDEHVKKVIVDRITTNDQVPAADVGVHVQNGHVVLKGTVPDGLAREKVLRDIQQITGVVTVDNQLDVHTPLSEVDISVTDEQREHQIRKAFSTLPIAQQLPEVSVNGGIVTLKGVAETLWLKICYGKIASETAGVTKVLNDIHVIPANSVSDASLTKTIIDILHMYNSSDLDRIDVEVEEGVVTVSGTVPNDSDRQVVRNSVANVAGVRGFEDHLRTPAPTQP